MAVILSGSSQSTCPEVKSNQRADSNNGKSFWISVEELGNQRGRWKTQNLQVCKNLSSLLASFTRYRTEDFCRFPPGLCLCQLDHLFLLVPHDFFLFQAPDLILFHDLIDLLLLCFPRPTLASLLLSYNLYFGRMTQKQKNQIIKKAIYPK